MIGPKIDPTAPMLDAAILAPERVRPLRRSEYDRLVELGFFQDERIELLNGTLVAVSPHGAAHAYVTSILNKILTRAVGDRALVRIQCPLALADHSEPEPDLALVPPEDYSREHPTRAWLVIEVAESSLRKDRLVKAALYARAGIPEYWIVNLRERVIEVYRDPRAEGYGTVTSHGVGEVLRPAAFADVEIAVAAALPG